MDGASRRLAQLARILSDTRPFGEPSTTDRPEPLQQVRLKRIQDVTAQLDAGTARPVDEVDAVAMRLVLDEYASVVAHLRAAAREGAATLGSLAAQLKTYQRLLDEQFTRREKPRASTAPSDRQPASRNPGR